MEKKLINKSYYETLIGDNKHPIKALGEMYIREMQENQPDLSAIRFAQGEVYYLNHDYEAAIYKWQHPLEEKFIPWAKKNIADAHMELGLLEYAEKFYKEVETESIPLQTEVLLQLFSLYIQQENIEQAMETIKKAVLLNPDYDDVTEVAKRYFEENDDWESAIELSVNEALRTESLSWFDVLISYAPHEYITNYEPNYFKQVLKALLNIDTNRFERLTERLWKSYEESEFYFQWLEEVNDLLANNDWEPLYTWEKLPGLFKNAYSYLTSGKYLIKEISPLMKEHLMNWFEVSSNSDRLRSSTAIIAWNEQFPAQLDLDLIQNAGRNIEQSDVKENSREEGIELFTNIKNWVKREGLLEELNQFLQPKLAGGSIELASRIRIVNIIKEVIDFISEQKIEWENAILQEIDSHEELLTKLQEFHEQNKNAEKEKAEIMTASFRDKKSKLIENVQTKLMELLRNSSDLVKEDADFSKLHTELNKEINERISQFMESDVYSEFIQAFEEWIEDCKKEFQESQIHYIEFTDSIESYLDNEEVVLSGDFKVLDDWKRDIDRLSRGLLRIREVNILLRNNPYQLILKGAGRLLGSLAKNKNILYKRYKDYIENADFNEVVEETIQAFTVQLDLFEESIDWDVSRFYSNPQETLNQKIEEVQAMIESKNEALRKRRENPELYQDPITLFKLRLRQIELMSTVETVG